MAGGLFRTQAGAVMKPFLRCCLLGVLGLAGAFLLWGAGWVTWAYFRDPMVLLDRGARLLVLVERRETDERIPGGEVRRIQDLTFQATPVGPLRVVVSLPVKIPHPLPVVVVLGGLEAGRKSLSHVPRHGVNALVACDYPQQPSWYEGAPLGELPSIRAAALAMPELVAGLMTWIRSQPWADSGRVSLLGYSFGAVFAPACTRLLEHRGQGPFRLVMAFGGADLPGLFDANVAVHPRPLKWAAGRTLGALVRPLEPSLHLPHLRTGALVILGTGDAKVPYRNARLMHDLHGGPKHLLELNAPHLDPRRPDLSALVVEASRAWLVAQGAMNALE